MGEIKHFPYADWTRLDEELPPDRAQVLVIADSWSAPRRLEYDANFHGKDRPTLIDRMAGRWYWYPERMKWKLPPASLRNQKEETGNG